jgi:hypothetical protein
LEQTVQTRIDRVTQLVVQNTNGSANNLQLQYRKNKYLYQREIVYRIINYVEKVDGGLEPDLTHFKKHSTVSAFFRTTISGRQSLR